MASFTRTVQIPGKSADEIYQKIDASIERFLGKESTLKFDFERDPAAKTVHMKSSYATARLVCRDGEVHLEAKLGLLASAFRGRIDDGINKWLQKTFSV